MPITFGAGVVVGDVTPGQVITPGSLGVGISLRQQQAQQNQPVATGSVQFNGSNYLSTTQSAYVTSGNFTIECWAYVTSVSSYAGFVSFRDTNAPNPGADINLLNNGNIEFAIGNSSQYISTAMPLNQWVHLAMSRTGTGSNNVSCYVNGIRVAQFTNTDATSTLGGQLAIGRYYANSNQYYLNGYLSNVRYVVGTAVYTGASVTVPTAPLTAVAGTVLLTAQSSSAITDASANAFAITNNGGASASTSTPFVSVASTPVIYVPDPPNLVSVTSSGTSVAVAFDPPAYNGGSTITSYTVVLQSTATSTSTVLTQSGVE